MLDVDKSVMSLSMKLGNRVTRKSFLGRLAIGVGVLTGGAAGAVAFPRSAEATHEWVSIQCLYHPDIYTNGCPSPYCTGGSWFNCGTNCGTRMKEWFDCCYACSNCHTHPDPSDPNGQGYSCCWTGYCASGCGSNRVVCRYYRCTNFTC